MGDYKEVKLEKAIPLKHQHNWVDVTRSWNSMVPDNNKKVEQCRGCFLLQVSGSERNNFIEAEEHLDGRADGGETKGST